jgi:SAM-dependent methyltransferase
MTNPISAAEQIYAAHLRKAVDDPYHAILPKFSDRVNTIVEARVLEIGARKVSGNSHRNWFHTQSGYTGLDIHSGPGVDKVGDAHQLSGMFPADHFDAVFSESVFEHLAFPWKAAMEINTVLKTGGLCYVSTHPVWPPHELPWDFWRFPLAGLKLLFSEPMGFRVLEATEGLPGRVHSMVDDAPTRDLPYVELNLGVALIAEKIADYDHDKIRWDVPIETVLDSHYPKR